MHTDDWGINVFGFGSRELCVPKLFPVLRGCVRIVLLDEVFLFTFAEQVAIDLLFQKYVAKHFVQIP